TTVSYIPCAETLFLYSSYRNTSTQRMPAAPLSGNSSRCLDAFTVALSHGCDEGQRRWYTSTSELQLASLDFCLECRNVTTSRIRM
ncbi:unnamed protein product, partial [Ectocarpus fasciculatus]